MSQHLRITFLLLTWAAYAWRVQGLDWQSLWRDEVDAIYFATRHLPDTLSMFVRAGQNGPLFFLALRPWFWLAGTREFALRYISAMAGALSVVLLWQVARRLFPAKSDAAAIASDGLEQSDEPVSPPPSQASSRPSLRALRFGFSAETIPFLAAAFLAFNPYQLWYSQEGKMYTTVTALVLLATLFFWEGITVGGWRPWLGYLLTVTVALYTHLLLLLLYPLHFLWFVIAWPLSRVHWKGYTLALAGLILPYAPMAWWQWDLLIADRQMTGFAFTPLREMLRVLILNHSRGFMPPAALLWMAPIFFLGAAGILLGAGEIAPQRVRVQRVRVDVKADAALAPWRRMLLLLSWLLVPILSLYLLSLRQPIFTDRYLVWIAPAAMILLALGVQAARRYAGPFSNALAAALAVYVLAFWLYGGWQQKTLPMKYDLRSGVAHVAALRAPGSLLILQIPHLQYAMRYYSSDFGPRPFDGSEERLAPWAGGLWTNNGWADDQARGLADQQMREMTAGASDVWVLRSEVEMWDQRHLMEEWLESHGAVVDQADYHGVQVRRYMLGR